MNVAGRLVMAARRLVRERDRKLLANGQGPLDRIQARAWPGRDRLKRSWHEETFVVLDTETTGLDSNEDQPVALGGVRLRGARIALGETFERIMTTGRRMSGESIVVHGITPEKLAEGQDPGRVAKEFLLWVGEAVLVGHHAMFDLAMLGKASTALLPRGLQNMVLDTAALSRRLENDDGGRYDLDSLLERHGIPTTTHARHSALGDAILTARLFQVILKKLELRGVATLDDLAAPGITTHRF